MVLNLSNTHQHSLKFCLKTFLGVGSDLKTLKDLAADNEGNVFKRKEGKTQAFFLPPLNNALPHVFPFYLPIPQEGAWPGMKGHAGAS